MKSPLAAHPGYHKMFATLKQNFFRPRMKKDTLEFPRKCLICQKTKAKCVKLLGKLHPHDVPQMKWECISMDFVTRFPKVTRGFDSISVVVDKLTKVAHLILVKTTSIAADIAHLFVKEIVRLHGILARIINDQDAKFTSPIFGKPYSNLWAPN